MLHTVTYKEIIQMCIGRVVIPVGRILIKNIRKTDFADVTFNRCKKKIPCIPISKESLISIPKGVKNQQRKKFDTSAHHNL